jgi:hypothetical protein
MLAAWLDIVYNIAGWLAMLDMLEDCHVGWLAGWLAVQPGRPLGYAG